MSIFVCLCSCVPLLHPSGHDNCCSRLKCIIYSHILQYNFIHWKVYMYIKNILIHLRLHQYLVSIFWDNTLCERFDVQYFLPWHYTLKKHCSVSYFSSYTNISTAYSYLKIWCPLLILLCQLVQAYGILIILLLDFGVSDLQLF